MMLGKYQLVSKLATGGMAEVYLARADGPMGFTKALVVKRILPHLAEDPQFVEMFIAEARLAAQLNHPNIVQIFDFGEADGTWFLAMEYIDGLNLRVLAKRARAVEVPLPPACCARIIASACEGLAFAHDSRDPELGVPLGLIHRDISPDNILLSHQGAVKVVDFGIAKAADQGHRTQTGVIKGKLAYMPPEQLRGAALDRRVDVYALGIVLYELLTGHKPFDATTEASMVQAILHEPFIPAEKRQPDLPVALRNILERALAKDRDQRYPDCHVFQADLERFMVSTGEPVGTWHLAQLMKRVTALSEAAVTEPISGYTPGRNTPAKGTPPKGIPSKTPAKGTPPKGTPPKGMPSKTPAKGIPSSPQEPRPELVTSMERPAPTLPTRKETEIPAEAPASEPRLEPDERSARHKLGKRLVAVAAGVAVLLVLTCMARRDETPGPQPVALQEPAVSTPRATAPPRQQPPAPAPLPKAAEAEPAPEKPQETKTETPAGAIASADPSVIPPAPETKRPEPTQEIARPEPPPPPRTGPRKNPSIKGPKNRPIVVPVLDLEPAQTRQKPGSLEFRIRPYAIVWVDGKRLGQTPLPPYELPAGKHMVQLVNEEQGKHITLQVEIQAGKPYILKYNLGLMGEE
ncbi:MAG TPA: protein kinase [Archangium sp.]|uniref:serine/threonine protein kinase n=1 Tax=Archangium sp. TaxID=1872627 RepID=UPI002E32B5EA|nr:protein kinase [Archangium sp.]HEX5754055.1 protein kinase [Archangium sp.]